MQCFGCARHIQRRPAYRINGIGPYCPICKPWTPGECEPWGEIAESDPGAPEKTGGNLRKAAAKFCRANHLSGNFHVRFKPMKGLKHD